MGDSFSYDEAVGAPPATAGAPADASFSYADAVGHSAHPGGVLSNSPDDGMLAGAAKGTGTAVVKGLANAAGQVGNLNNLAEYLISRGEHYFTGRPVEEIQADLHKQAGAAGLGKFSPTSVMPSGQDIADPILKKTGEYEPTSELGKIGQAGLETAIGMVGPGGGAAAKGAGGVNAAFVTPLKAALPNAAAGGAGQAVTDATGDPLLGLGASFASGAATHGAAKAGAKIIAPVAEDIPIVGKAFAGTRERLAGERLAKDAEDPAALRETLDPTKVEDGAASVAIPGSKPTLGELSGDMGILRAERTARTENNVDFNNREADQNSARRTAVAGAAPADADAMKPSALFHSQVDAVDKAEQAAVDHLTQVAQQKAAAVPPGRPAEDIGAQLRGALEDARSTAKAERNKLYDAVDPEKKLVLVTAPVRDSALAVAKGVSPYGQPMTGDEARIFSTAKSLPDTMPFDQLRALDQDISAAMSAEKRGAGETPAWARLSQLKSAVKGAISNAVDNEGAYKENKIAAARAARDEELRAPVEQPKQPPPLTISQFIRRHGGLEITGDTKSADLNKFFVTGGGRLATRDGRSIDGYWRENLMENGYLPKNPDGSMDRDIRDELIEAIRRDQSGDPVYSEYDQHRVPSGRDAVDEYNQEIDHHAQSILDAQAEHGIQPEHIDQGSLYRAAELLQGRHETDPISALERASIERENEAGYANDSGSASGPRYAAPEGGAEGRGSGPQEGSLRTGTYGPSFGEDSTVHRARPRAQVVPSPDPNFDPAAADRLKTANAAHAEYKGTYGQGPVKGVLKTNGFASNYALPDSAVPSRAFVPGDRGYETVGAFLKAAKGAPDAVQAIADHATAPLRKSLNPDGTVNPKVFAKWKSDYAPAIRAIDEAVPGFSGRLSDAAKASDAMLEAVAHKRQALDDIQSSAASKFLGKQEPVEVENEIGRILSNKTKGPADARELVARVGKDTDALDGLRKAGVDWMLRTLSQSAEAGTSGEKTLSPAKFSKFITDNEPTLNALFEPRQVNMFKAVAADMERSNRSVTASAIKGSPGTAKDMTAVAAKAGEKHGGSWLTRLMLAGYAGLEHGGIKGAALGAGSVVAGHFANTLRKSGFEKVDTLYREALLHPEKARLYLSKVPSGDDAAKWSALSGAFRKAMLAAPVLTTSK